jgi:hypothetical protein
MISFLSSCTLFSESSTSLQVNSTDLDELVFFGKGLQNTLSILSIMDKNSIKFQSFSELIPEIKYSIKFGIKLITDNDRQSIVTYLSNSSQLFSKSTEKLSVTAQSINKLILLCGSTAETTLNTLRELDKQNSKFQTFDELIQFVTMK